MKKTPWFDFFLCCLLILLFSCVCLKVCLGDEKTSFKKCNGKEREALVAFKNSLVDPSGRLISWVGGDCCNWEGVGCNNQTGVVTKIDLRNPLRSRDGVYDPGTEQRFCLGGKINASLLELNYLNYLDLSLNDFGGIPFPGFISMLKNLSYLNLSSSSFAGEIPSELGNLSNLQHLDLYDSGLEAKSLHWVSSLFSLRYLNLGKVLLHSVSKDWLHSINQLPSLVELHLYKSDIENTDLYLPLVNFTSLVTLRMSSNFFNTSFPLWLSKLTSLETLHLHLNGLTGPIPNASLCNLKNLDLSSNYLNVSLRDVFGLFTGCSSNRLEFMNLRDSGLVGEIPKDLGPLNNLRFLQLSSNSLWGSIPSSIGNLLSLKTLDLSSNNINGAIPESLRKLTELNSIDLSSNRFRGRISPYICSIKSLSLLSFRNNKFSGQLPDCWEKLPKLRTLDASNNCISGQVPRSIGNSKSLRTLLLRNNDLVGEFPRGLQNCSALIILDLRKNRLSGKLPTWIGSSLPSLIILFVGGNFFEGGIPQEICYLSDLHFLDLSKNKLSGAIPKCFSQLFALNSGGGYDIYHDIQNRYGVSYDGHTHAVINGKGIELEHNRDLSFLNGIDLSSNHLSGAIPGEITSLSLLKILNLSGNHLSGSIPKDIGNLRELESLDFSLNNLSGSIPQSLSSLIFLGSLNLSNNNLVGKIPEGTQLESMPESSYKGNMLLCGYPLHTSCPFDEAAPSSTQPDGAETGDGRGALNDLWFYLSVVAGFVFGFWGVCGTLIIKKSWRIVYFKFLDNIGDRMSRIIASSM